jgi:hypothetical protein
MTTQTPSAPQGAPPRDHARAIWAGATFVWIYLGLAGVLQVIYGIATLRNRDYFHEDGLLWSNLTSWGWLAIVLGALEILIAVKVYQRTLFGAVAGTAIAVCAFIANFLSIGAYPAWSIIAMVVNAYVIWALPRSIDTS